MYTKVSIIVPSYKRNRELFSRAIESLLAQSYEYRQALYDYIQELNSDKIKYIQNQENLGGALSRNVGIENATGEYITFLDDDDRYLKDKVKNQLDFMLKNDLEMSFTDLSIYNENEKLIDYRDHNDISQFDKDYLMKYHLTKQITGTPTFMVKKSVLLDINGFDNVPMGQEFYLMMKIINSDAKLGYVSQNNIVAYRTSLEAISTGPKKISGQKELFKYKKTYFKILSFSEKQYIRCRHYAVMAVAYKRNKKYFKMMASLIVSVMSNPILAIREAIKLSRKINKKIKDKQLNAFM